MVKAVFSGRHPRCKRGHTLEGGNVYLVLGKKRCRRCQRELAIARLAAGSQQRSGT